jgi:hypothetical protein
LINVRQNLIYKKRLKSQHYFDKSDSKSLRSQKNSEFKLIHEKYFYSNLDQVIQLLNQEKLDLHTEIWLRWDSHVETSRSRQKIIYGWINWEILFQLSEYLIFFNYF